MLSIDMPFSDTDAVCRVIRNAGHRSTVFPQRVWLIPPHATTHQAADIYARIEENSPTIWRYKLLARFVAPVETTDGHEPCSEEFTIEVDSERNTYRLVFRVMATAKASLDR